MNCSKCGSQNIDGVTFCGSCGAQMESNIPQSHQQQQPQYPPPPPPQYQQPPPPQYQQQQPTYGAGQQGGYNTQSGAASGNIPSNGGMIMPKNYMVESIVLTVFSLTCCCNPIALILGIIAIVKAGNVSTEFERGNISEAISNADSAKKLVIWGAIIMVLLYIVSVIISVTTGVFGALMEEYNFNR